MKEPLSPTQKKVAVGGAVALVVGLVLMWMALAPLSPIMAVMKNPQAADPAVMKEFDANLKRAALPAAIGGVLLLAAFVMLQLGLTRKERSVDDIVEEKLERRLAAMRAAESEAAKEGVPPAPSSAEGEPDRAPAKLP